MKLEPVYNGHQFPVYSYDGLFMVLEVTPKRGLAEGKNPEYLYLPAAEHQIERTLLRVGVTSLHDAQIRIDCNELRDKAVAPPQFTPSRNAGRGDGKTEVANGFRNFIAKCCGSLFGMLAPVLAPESMEILWLGQN